ncbi:MAG: sigma-70 family RNA polymerase sigma factor [Deltaproteobacteria bacterium]|nr:sigma-70 family RNA polymerase sigma factor [Deltaproteobacteria bacterium]
MSALTTTVAAATPASRELPSIAQLYARHFRRVWWVVRSAGVPDEAIEDVVHDVFVALHHRLPSYDGRLPLERWLIGVARNTAFSHRRGAARRTLRVAELARVDTEPVDLDDHVAQARAWRELQRFLVELPDEQREVFTLIELNGDSAPSVAADLEVKLNTVYARLRLARGKFDRWLVQHGHGDPQWTRDAAPGGAPREAQRARAWAAIAISLRASAGLGAGFSTAKLAVMIGVLATAGVAAVALRSGPEPPIDAPPSTEPRTQASASDPVHAVEAREPRSDPRSPLAAVPATAAPTVVRAHAGPASTGQRPRAVDGPAVRDGTATADGPAPGDEQRWLAHAHEAIAQGEAERALSWIDRHAHAYPDSALAPERVVLRVDALCQAGRRDEAEAAVASWRHDHAQRLPRIAGRLAARLDDDCGR